MPLVSIILPTFNRSGYLRSAIESVVAQTFADWELIVADDGSAEDTRSYLRSIVDSRTRVLWLPHSGNPSAVRNAAIDRAGGEYLAFLDSDDIWAPRKLENQVGALRNRLDRRWSYTHCDRIDMRGHPIVDEPLSRRLPLEGWILEPMLTDLRYQMPMASVVAERELVREVGAFDEHQRWCEDYDLLLRLAMRSQVAATAEPLCSIRAHEEHYSADRIAEYDGRIRVYGKMAELVADPRLRALCGRRRAEQSLILAGLRGDKGDLRGAWRTVRAASAYSSSYPGWWVGVLKALVRPLLPEAALRVYRRRRR